MNLKKILFILLTLSLSLVFSSCTQPDGYIGKWFGSWYLEEMLINGEVDEEYAAYQQEGRFQVMVSFQGNIFHMAYIGGQAIYGTWSYAGEVLTLVASYNAGSATNSPYFDPYPKVLHFPASIEQMEITVSQLYSKTMQWQIIDPEGRLVTYNFRKYP